MEKVIVCSALVKGMTMLLIVKVSTVLTMVKEAKLVILSVLPDRSTVLVPDIPPLKVTTLLTPLTSKPVPVKSITIISDSIKGELDCRLKTKLLVDCTYAIDTVNILNTLGCTSLISTVHSSIYPSEMNERIEMKDGSGSVDGGMSNVMLNWVV